MKKIGYVYDTIFTEHDTGFAHAESPDRVRALDDHLTRSSLNEFFVRIAPTPAPLEWIHTIHDPNYVDSVARRIASGETVLDFGDTHVCKRSFDVALHAAGGVINAIDLILADENDVHAAFCAVRPPGHHAETNEAMGFCLFNNIAIGARYAQEAHGVERVAIIDWDVHHGNGTQWSFYDDPSVMYVSLHQYPHYPGTGAANEVGIGRGEGATLNCPMRAGSGHAEYQEAFRERIIPALERFQPDLVMISAGFDAHRDDPLASINLTEESYAMMTEMLGEIAAKFSQGKILSVLEGGYNLTALARSAESHLGRLIHGAG